jgi:hypothetical protein
MRAISALVIIGLILTTTSFAFVDAQDYYERYKPTMSGPNISVTSPQNASVIESNSLQLIFNVTEPQIVKLSPNISPNIIENNGVRNSSDIVRVYYKGDWQNNQTILYSNQNSDIDFLEFNETLSNIPNGRHQLEITSFGSIGLIVAMFGSTYQNNATTTIVFTTNYGEPTPTLSPPTDRNPPHLEPIDYLLPVSVIVAIAVLSVLLYRRHQKTASQNKPNV